MGRGSRPRCRFLLRPAGPLLGTGLQRAHERSGVGSPGPRPPTSGLSPTSRFRPSRRPSTTGPARASPRLQRSTVPPPDPRGPCRTRPERLCSRVTRWGCRRAETRRARAKDGVSRGSPLARAPPSLRLIPGCCTSDWKRRFENYLLNITYIERALDVVKLESAERLTNAQIERCLEDAAEDLIETLLERVHGQLRRKLRKAIEIHVDSESHADRQLTDALGTTVTAIRAEYSGELAEEKIKKAEQEFRAM